MRGRDLAAVLDFLTEARSLDAPVPFTPELVDRLMKVVDCDTARYKELDVARRVEIAHLPCSAEMDAFPLDPEGMTEADWDELSRNPCFRASRSEPSGIFIASELIARPVSPEEVLGWQEEFRRYDFVDRMWIGISGPTCGGVAFDRSEQKFGEQDRQLARVLQPHLGELWREASVRRRLRAALAALDQEGEDGVLLVSAAGAIEFASDSARRILRDHFGTSAVRMPEAIADWYASGRMIPLVVAAGGARLVVEATEGGSALLLRERPAGVELLTPREREVMRCVAAGLSNTEIARRLWIEDATVRKHLEHVYQKLGVRSRSAAMAKLSVGRSIPSEAPVPMPSGATPSSHDPA
ncbi:MAG TPA: helix-turn-helix transcriptional regulator [Actinomycetota bacterium]|nr:helix-turn-helix transcriptional regulator [Actinomycetota bacterium]